MELLLGSVISILTEIFKWLTKKIGTEMSKAVILIVVFILALIAAWIKDAGYFSTIMQGWFTIVGVAIGFYEIIWKRILVKIFQTVKTE